MYRVSELDNLYVFGLNYGFIIQLKQGYGLVIAPEGDFENCILTEKFESMFICEMYLKHNADFGLTKDVPDWKFRDITRYLEDVYVDNTRNIRISE